MDMKRCIFGSVGDQTVIMVCVGMRNISIKCRKCVYKSKFGCLAETRVQNLNRNIRVYIPSARQRFDASVYG